MASTTVRINEQTHRILSALASQCRMSKVELVARAVENLRRQQMLERTNAAYAALRADPQAWREEQAEREEWDSTLADGLEDQ